MTQMPNDYEDFASYLHDPYSYPSDEVKLLMKPFLEKCADNNDYILNHLSTLLSDFKNNSLLHKYGLNHFYALLKTAVEKNDLLGLVWCGASEQKYNDVLLTRYTTVNNKTIRLTINSVCKHFLNYNSK
jgi:hypothetical protein